MKIENVALLGAGAVGAYFIWGLSERLGEHFCVVAKNERKERLEKEGLRINGKQYALSVKTSQQVKDVDLLLVASKQDALEEALEDIKAIVGENTIVISLLNGVRSEEIIGNAILGVGFQAYKDSEHMHYIAKCLWKEVAQVAHARGIPLDEELVLFQGVKKNARFLTLQDLDAGRHTEIEMLAGEMVRMGSECGITVPYCEYTYHLIKALEEKNDGKFEYTEGKYEV